MQIIKEEEGEGGGGEKGEGQEGEREKGCFRHLTLADESRIIAADSLIHNSFSLQFWAKL